MASTSSLFWVIFQSTLPVRGATPAAPGGEAPAGISIHAPRAGSDPPVVAHTMSSSYFNPRSPCGERREYEVGSREDPQFQSTLPVRGATPAAPGGEAPAGISIHAPRAGSDIDDSGQGLSACDFNPRSPCGERRRRPACRRSYRHFNPRSPCGERPAGYNRTNRQHFISIHAPRAGSDYSRLWPAGLQDYFNPRSPCGERRNPS